MFGELFDTILAQKKIRDAHFPDCQSVFFNQQTGEPVGIEFRDTWNKALASVKLEGRLFHDLRRTAVRNMVRAGVGEKVAMKISGHKTRSVFDRYNIVNEDDLKKASQRVREYHLQRVKMENGHNLGTVQAQEAQIQLEDQPVNH